MNNYNFPAAYLALKSIVEINGSLAYILDVIKTSLNLPEKSEKLKLVFFGNRGKGPFRIGDIDVPNILTMLTKADRLIEKISPGSKHLESFFTNIYDIASTPSHPSFDAHSLIGKLDSRNRTWQAFSLDEMKNNTTIEFNNQRLLILSMSYLPIFCQLIHSNNPAIFTKHGTPYFQLN
jgi:hypothetical protein